MSLGDAGAPWRGGRQGLGVVRRGVSHADQAKDRPTGSSATSAVRRPGRPGMTAMAGAGVVVLALLLVGGLVVRGGDDADEAAQGSAPDGATPGPVEEAAAASPTGPPAPSPFPVESRPEGSYVARGVRTALVPAGYPGVPPRETSRFALSYADCTERRCRGTLGGEGPAFTWDGTELSILPKRSFVRTGRCVEPDGSLAPPDSTATWRTTITVSDASATPGSGGGPPTLRYSSTERLRYLRLTGACRLEGDELQYFTYRWTARPEQRS